MGALDPQDPVWRPESWFLHAARRAHQLNSRRVDALDRRLARDDTCHTSPFVEFADSGSASESLVDALLEGRLEAPEPNAPPSPRPREVGLYHAARTNDEVGVVPTVAPARWNARWPKTRVPGRRFVAVFDDEPASAAVFDAAAGGASAHHGRRARAERRVAAIARAFRGLERAGQTPVKRVSPPAEDAADAADAADASSSDLAELSETERAAAAEPAELSEMRTLDRAAYFFSSDQCLSPYDAKGETADEAFARLSLAGARERSGEQTAKAFRTARESAKRMTLFQLRKVKLAMSRAEEEE